MNTGTVCPICGKGHKEQRYFCEECGTFLNAEMIDRKELYEIPEIKVKRILENLKYTGPAFNHALGKSWLTASINGNRHSQITNVGY